MSETVKVGDTFYRSWGYDQTNVNFYEVVSVSKTGKTAKAKEVKTVSVETNRVTAATGADRFVTDGGCAKCLNRHAGQDKRYYGHDFTEEYNYSARTDHVTVWSDDHAYRWDGQPKYQTSYGFGH